MPAPLRAAVGLLFRVGLVLACLLPAPTAAADWRTIEERWYVLSLDGTPCGRMQVVVDRDGEDRLRTSSRSLLRFARDRSQVTLESSSVFEESARGEPIAAVIVQRTGAQPTETEYAFHREGGSYRVIARTAGKESSSTVAADGWLTPQGVERFVAERMKAGAEEIRYRALDLDAGPRLSAVTMLRSGAGTAAAADEAQGPRTVPVSEWTVTNDLVPVRANEQYDAKGTLVESSMRLGIGELRSRLGTRAAALAASEGRGAEILVRSFAPAKTPIRGAMESTRLRLRVRALEGTMPDLPAEGAQRVKRIAPNELEVDVVADRGSPVEAGATDVRYLASTPLIDGDTEAVAELVAKALADRQGLSPREKAEELRRFVFRWVREKNLASAFASASETAISKAGDCSEHAVLLAAMLRKAGIPARLASGLVYADRFAGERDVWGWHVWTQAEVPVAGGGDAREWIDLDATLPVRYHAAHLLTGVSDLAGGASDPMWTQALRLIGNVSIETIDPPERSGDDAQGARPPTRVEPRESAPR
jgi:transglutaminase-like putative cysteine protease